MANITHHTKAQTVKLGDLVRDSYASSGKNDQDFARHASDLLGFKCTARHVSETREIFGLPNNLIEQRRSKDPRSDEQQLSSAKLASAVDAIEEKVDLVVANHNELVEHNRILLRSIEDLKSQFSEFAKGVERDIPAAMAVHFATLQCHLDARLSQHAAPPAESKPLSGKPAVERKRVAISGLSAQQRSLVTKEFGEALDVRFVDGDDAKQSEMRVQAKTCDAIVTLSGHVPADVKALMKQRGCQVVQLHGSGMTTLRDKLTEIFVGE